MTVEEIDDVKSLILPLECVEVASTKLSRGSITLGEADYVLEKLITDLDENKSQFAEKLKTAVARRVLQRRTSAARCARLITPGPSAISSMDLLLEPYREGRPPKPMIDVLLEECEKFDRTQEEPLDRNVLFPVIRTIFEGCLKLDSHPEFRSNMQRAMVPLLTQKFCDMLNIILPTSVAAERSVAQYLRDNKANLDDDRFCKMFFLKSFFRVTRPCLELLEFKERCPYPDVIRVPESRGNSESPSILPSP